MLYRSDDDFKALFTVLLYLNCDEMKDKHAGSFCIIFNSDMPFGFSMLHDLCYLTIYCPSVYQSNIMVLCRIVCICDCRCMRRCERT